MTATDEQSYTLLTCRLDPLASPLPVGSNIAPPADGRPATVVLAVTPDAAADVEAMEEGSWDVIDHTTGTAWTIQIAPTARGGRAPIDREEAVAPVSRFVAYPSDEQPPPAEQKGPDLAALAQGLAAVVPDEPEPAEEVHVITDVPDPDAPEPGQAEWTGFAVWLEDSDHVLVPPGTDMHPGYPLLATLTIPKQVADNLTGAYNDGADCEVTTIDNRTGAEWLLYLAPEPTDGTPREYRGRPVVTPPQSVDVPELPGLPEIPDGAHGMISGTLWNGNHTPIPAGTVWQHGLVFLALDRDQFEALDSDIEQDIEHRGVIDRNTGARWTVTARASWGDARSERFKLAPAPSSVASNDPVPAPSGPDQRAIELAEARADFAMHANGLAEALQRIERLL